MSVRAGRTVAMSGAWRIAVLPPAALGVHQLRYQLAFGSGAAAELQRTGHSYLHSLVPWIVLCLALAVGCGLRAVGGALADCTTARRFSASFLGLWGGCAAALLAVFICQELLEGAFLTGHPAGWTGVFGYGGWWAVPAAVCIGLVLAAVFHGARWVATEISRRPQAIRMAGPSIAPVLLRPCSALLAAPSPLPRGRFSRGPPVR